MYLHADSLSTHLAKDKDLARLYTIHGDEPLLVQETADCLRTAVRAAGYTDRLIYTTGERGFDWRLLVGASQSKSLFGQRRLIELCMPTGKPGKNGSEALITLAALAANNHSDDVILVILPRLDAATQKSAWFAALANAGVVVRIDSIKPTQLPRWIDQRLKAQQQRVPEGSDGQRALQFIAERVEGNLLAAHQEIQKLGLLYPPGELTLAQINHAVLNVARYNVFHLGEAMLIGDIHRLIRMIDGLHREGEAPSLVLWMLVEEIRLLLHIKRGIAAGQPISALLHKLLHRHRRQTYEKLIEPALAKLTEATLEASLLFAARLDRQLKGLSISVPADALELPAYPWDGLVELALRIAAPIQSNLTSNLPNQTHCVMHAQQAPYILHQ